MWRPLLDESLRAQPVVRLNLLANLSALFDAGVVPAEVYLDGIARLVPDRDASVSERAIGRLSGIEHTLVTDASRGAFRAWAGALLRPIVQRLGWTPRAGETEAVTNLRRTALSAAGTLTDDPAVLREAENIATRYLRDARSVSGDIATVALPIASRRAGAERFDALVERLPSAATPQDRSLLLASLVTFDDLALVRRAYDLILTDTIRMQDLRALTRGAGATPGHRTLLYTWSRERIDDLERKLGRNMRFVIGSIGSLCDEAAVTDAERFMRERLGRLEGTDRNIALSANVARRCAVVRARESERAAAYFNRPRTPAATAR
jgi:aminopeptidase N